MKNTEWMRIQTPGGTVLITQGNFHSLQLITIIKWQQNKSEHHSMPNGHLGDHFGFLELMFVAAAIVHVESCPEIKAVGFGHHR